MLRLRHSQFAQFSHHKCIQNVFKHKSTKVTTNASQDEGNNVTADTESGGTAAATSTGSKKLTARKPLAKNFFMGIVDKELLAFPEVVSREELSNLQNDILPLKNFFEDNVDSRSIDATRSVPPTLLDNVRDLGLYGVNVPLDYEGKGWNWTQSLIATEPETNCTDIALSLLSHRVVIDVLKEVGTLDQQQRFLNKLASGSLFATEAVFEYNVSQEDFFNTSAEFCAETNKWTLNGTKAFVVAGPLATGASQLFLVIAQTRRLNMKGDAARSTTIFLVESSTPGVKLGDQHLNVGCRGVPIRQVQFDKVELADSCVLGEPHGGNRVADVLLRANRLRTALLGTGMAKNLVNDLALYAVGNKQCGVVLKDMEVVQLHLSKAMCATYAMESMTYMTAGLLDEFDAQDVALEAAITKYFTLKQLFKIASSSMDIIGPKSLHSGESTELAFRNAAQLYTQGESMDTLRLFIALTGMQHAGTLLQNTVRKSRNPLFHPSHMLGKFLQSSSIDNPNTKMRLGESVHPTLEPAAQCIEHSVARLQMCVELLLTRYGNAIVERHSDLQRIAEMSTVIYAMFASVSRASRSYCIGIQLADHELLTASTISLHGRDTVKTLCTEVFNGEYVNTDNSLQRISKQLAKSKGYFAVHPLTFNY